MNERERFRRLARGEPVDRPPLFEEGVRDQVIERWRTEGLAADQTHTQVFGLTEHERVGPDVQLRPSYRRRVMDLSHREYRQAFGRLRQLMAAIRRHLRQVIPLQILDTESPEHVVDQ